jgi:hypothetical protein
VPNNFITIVLSGHTLGYSVLLTKGTETSNEIVRVEDIATYTANLAFNEQINMVKIAGPKELALSFREDILETAKLQYGNNNLEIEVI